MKNFILGTVFCSLIAANSWCQTLKPTVGLNFTDVVGSGDESRGRTGFQVGASMAFGEKMYVEPGIFYVGKSSTFTSPDNSEPDLDSDLKGIRVPITLGAYLIGNEESKATLRGFGGASGFFVTSVSDGLNKEDFDEPAWGVFAGLGLDVWIIFVDVSYEWSVNDIQLQFTNIDFGRTNGLFANAGLRFKL